VTDKPARYVRYAESMTIHIDMRPDSSGRIYAPYIEIDYGVASRSNMTDTVASVTITSVRRIFVTLLILM